MSYWQRVTIQDYIEVRTATGAVQETWSDDVIDTEARVLPLNVMDRDEQWATPQEDTYEVQFRGALTTLRPRQRIVIEDEYYEVRRILLPPPFGTPTTIAWTVKVTP